MAQNNTTAQSSVGAQPRDAYVLAFDTANEVVAIGLGCLRAESREVQLVAAHEVAAHRASNTQLLPQVDALLARAGVARSEIASVCVGRGPGSFTGVRIAMATAKGVASALDVALVGVSSLDVVAWNCWAAGTRGPLAVVADAMRKEVYPVRYVLDDSGVQRLEADSVVKAAVAAEKLAQTSAASSLSTKANALQPLNLGSEGSLNARGSFAHGPHDGIDFVKNDTKSIPVAEFAQTPVASGRQVGSDSPSLQIAGDGLCKYAELFEACGTLLPEGVWGPTGAGLLLALQAAWRAGQADPFDVARHNPGFLLPVYTRLSDAEENERVRLAKNNPKNLVTGVQDVAVRRDQRATMHDSAILNARPDEAGITYKPLDAAHTADVAALEAEIMGSDAWNMALVADELPRPDRTWWAAYASPGRQQANALNAATSCCAQSCANREGQQTAARIAPDATDASDTPDTPSTPDATDAPDTPGTPDAPITTSGTKNLAGGANSENRELLVGYAGGWVVDGQVQILKVGVRPEFRRQGIARKLLALVAHDARDLGASNVSLEVREANTAAQAFYETLGMKCLGCRPRYYSDREDAAIFEGPLEPVIGGATAGCALQVNIAPCVEEEPQASSATLGSDAAQEGVAVRAGVVAQEDGAQVSSVAQPYGVVQASPVSVAGMYLQLDAAHDAQAARTGQAAHDAQVAHTTKAARNAQAAHVAQPANMVQVASEANRVGEAHFEGGAQPTGEVQLTSEVQPASEVNLASDAQTASETEPARPLILAIESSCDETAAAISDANGVLLADVVASQIDFHARFGGVVPEIASRKHIEAICGVCDECLELAAARLGRKRLTWADLDGVAVTYAPGLVGALVVGVAFAKGAAWAANKPLVGVNHLEGHLYANKIGAPNFAPPAVVSLVSGGNTMLVHMRGWGDYEILGATIDDAVGEAFDKVAKALGLGYPGGPAVSKLAAKGDAVAIAFPRAMMHSGDLRFSLSGLKTAVVTYINNERAAGRELNLPNICASFQQAVVDVQVKKAGMALDETGAPTFCLGGGVAANPVLRAAYEEMCAKRGVQLVMPPLSACGDNAGMIALVAQDRFMQGKFMGLDADAFAHANLEEPY